MCLVERTERLMARCSRIADQYDSTDELGRRGVRGFSFGISHGGGQKVRYKIIRAYRFINFIVVSRSSVF